MIDYMEKIPGLFTFMERFGTQEIPNLDSFKQAHTLIKEIAEDARKHPLFELGSGHYAKRLTELREFPIEEAVQSAWLSFLQKPAEGFIAMQLRAVATFWIPLLDELLDAATVEAKA